MGFLTTLKGVAERAPEPIGRHLALVPYSLRLGPTYSRMRAEIVRTQCMSPDEQRDYAFIRFRQIVLYAAANIPFYRALYAQHRFEPELLRSLDDVDLVPIVRKQDLRSFALEQRARAQRGRLLVNTGGTSGQPLEFYLDRHAFAREWAHMHAIWGTLGYKHTDVKLTFRGKNLEGAVSRYNPVHNEFLLSAYRSEDEVCAEVRMIARRRTIRFLHGYPSAIYEFARHCRDHAPDLAAVLRGSLRGVFFGSEYPASTYRDVVEDVFGAPTMSWYGHSEFSVLAYERDRKFEYVPFPSYGFAEAVSQPDGHHLVATSYHNGVSPFIRYDTGDLIEPTISNGLLQHFRVAAGRIGDFITDRRGHRVSLTALIFGRHHAIFGEAEFVQVCQPAPGRAIVLVTLAPGQRPPLDWQSVFDSTNVDLELEFQTRTAPVRTAAGKVPLLVPQALLHPGA